jgi:hypothetical protein
VKFSVVLMFGLCRLLHSREVDSDRDEDEGSPERSSVEAHL